MATTGPLTINRLKASCLDAILTNALINSAKRVTSFLRASCPFLFTITRV